MYIRKSLHGIETGAGVDKFCLIRSHTRSRSQFWKHMLGGGVEKIRLCTPSFKSEVCTVQDPEYRSRFGRSWCFSILPKNIVTILDLTTRING